MGVLKKVKVEGLRFHDLRHTFASRLAMAGKDLYLIQRLLGHREPRMVQRYAHHSVESLRNGIEVLEVLKKKPMTEIVSQIRHSWRVTLKAMQIQLDETAKKSYGN